MLSPSSPSNSSDPHEQGALAIRICAIQSLSFNPTRDVLKRARPLRGPTLDHNFLLRIEFDGIAALGVHIAEEAVLPTGKGEESHRRGHANVNADIARQRLVAKFACRRAAAGEQAGHIAVG